MLRLIIRSDDANMASHVGGAVLTTYRTFDVDLPEVERALNTRGLSHAQLVGCEVIAPTANAAKED